MIIEEQLADMTANLVELEKNSIFLERLFSTKAGVWKDVEVLCQDLTEVKNQIRHVQTQLPRKLKATWLDYPNAAQHNDYCVIIFFSEDIHWSNVALYNKAWFLQRTMHRESTVL